ncbi:MAG: rhomboid family intramembrane serine protease [Acidobacteriaceae bacterium]|nr:rhomboid family intramembrane serine protease [Acidobacteriaceae bacterium]MBV9442749.1 rhomboid family intramembrane serine protease [Acidobacteriaceae bacterium]
MIPLRALILRRGTPVMTLVLIAINVFCFLIETAQPRYLESAFIAHYALVPDHFRPSALVTSMFLHGGWLHLIGNMWFLLVFGSHIEGALGSGRFLIFYLLCGIASALVQLMLNLGSPVPTLGASGAIAGVMGAFVLIYPRARVVTLVFIIIFITTIEIPAAFMLIYWFAIQLLSGLASFSSFTDQGGVAWFAHVGGFLAGLLFVRLFVVNRPRYSY